jgi:hypothetical protein
MTRSGGLAGAESRLFLLPGPLTASPLAMEWLHSSSTGVHTPWACTRIIKPVGQSGTRHPLARRSTRHVVGQCLATLNLFQDLPNQRWCLDTGDHAQFAAAFGAALNIDLKHSFQALGPAHRGSWLVTDHLAAGPAYRWLRFGGIAVLAILACWLFLVAQLESNLAVFSLRLAPSILLLQIATLVITVGSMAAALWNAQLAWTSASDWVSKAWSVLLVVSFAMLLWISVAFHLAGFNTDF